jgi:hypothetical protein
LKPLSVGKCKSDYSTAWVERYPGTGRRGFTESTRSDYRHDLKRYVNPRLGNLRLEQIATLHAGAAEDAKFALGY